MDILGLENNYYLAGNDIWIQVSNFPKVPIRLELEVTNLNTGATMPLFRLYSDINNVFKFNVSQTIRPLQPYPNHINLNTLQEYRMEFTVIFEDNTSEASTLDRYFIRGGRDKNNVDEWYLSDGYKLLISKWVDWRGILLPGYANKIQNNLIVDYIPSVADTFKMILPSSCNARIIKFLNSIGGYQYWVFESWEIKPKVKAQSMISQIPMQLRDDVSRNLGTDTTKEITLKTKTPAELQPIIMDLIESPEILMYDPAGVDTASSWHRLQLNNSNEAIYNSNDMSYLNEITYILPNYINRDL
jgi:hypothetical protein